MDFFAVAVEGYCFYYYYYTITRINLSPFLLPQDGNSTVVSVASKRGHSAHNERFHDEAEYERKVRKRRSRLVTATEEAFTHIRRMREDGTGREDCSRDRDLQLLWCPHPPMTTTLMFDLVGTDHV